MDYKSFLDDLKEMVSQINEATLNIEENDTDTETINQVFRALHNIKGAAGIFHLDRLAKLTHKVEDLYDEVRNGQRGLGPEELQFTLDFSDFLGQLSEDNLELESPNKKELAQAFQTRLEQLPHTPANGDQQQATAASKTHFVRFNYEKSIEDLENHPAFLLLNDLKEAYAGTQVHSPKGQSRTQDLYLPEGADYEEIEGLFIFYEDDVALSPVQVDPNLLTEQGMEALKDIYASGQLPLQNQLMATPKPDAGRDNKAGDSSTNTVRVAGEELDELMNWMSELVTLQARFQAMGEERKDGSIIGGAEEFGRVLHNMSDIIFSISLVSLETITHSLRRTIRDLAKELGKQVRFEVEGTDTQLNKDIIEPLTSPLVHIVRNALDHGMETPQEREAAGKKPKGLLRFQAKQQGNDVEIRIADDGKGMDIQKIKQKAIERGLLEAESDPAKEKIIQCIFEPGFSTAG